jgi:hypothetical protein
MATKYDIKRFSSSKDPDFVAALNIYCREISPGIYTNSDDIAYWIDRYQAYRPDELFIFGLYINNQISGFAQFVYMAEEELIFVDYMAIRADRRGHNSFYEFVSQIKDFVDQNYFRYGYILVEYPYMTHDGKEPSGETKRMIRLLKLLDFGVLKAPYFQPAHGTNNQESHMKSFLMIYTKKEEQEIRKETYLKIVKALYFKHYLRWYEPIDKDITAYKKYIDALYVKIAALVDKSIIIKINGYKRDEPPLTSGEESPKIPFMLYGVFIIVLTIAMSVMSRYFQIKLSSIIIFWLLSLLSFFALVAVFGNSKTALHIFNTLIKSINRLSGKAK